MATKTMSLKLLIDTKANKVIFAEAGKDFVDFLFGLLSLPVGAVIKLLTGRSSLGCIGNVYQSFGNLNESYMLPNLSKDILLNPNVSTSETNGHLLIANSHDSIMSPKFYSCKFCKRCVTNARNVGNVCPQCESDSFSRELTYIDKKGVASTNASPISKGYVQGLVMYMVSDDLAVTPLSMISSVKMINELNVTRLNVLEERVVQVGLEEVLELLKASFQTEATLTAVFLKKEANSKLNSCEATKRNTK